MGLVPNGGVAGALNAIITKVSDLVKGIINNDKARRERFVQEFIGHASVELPGYNVVICCHPGVRSEPPYVPYVIKETVWAPMTVGACEYLVLMSPKGKPFYFQNAGDGGWINWGFCGEFKRNGNVLIAIEHG
jgi:hypothetical protein